MTVVGDVVRAQACAEQGRWLEAFTHLAAADEAGDLDPAGLELLATAAHLIGRDADSARLWTRAVGGWQERDDPEQAARCTFWLVVRLLDLGEPAQASGWLSRAQRSLERLDGECLGHGYVLVPIGLQQLFGGEPEASLASFEQVAGIAERFDGCELRAFAQLGRGQALIRLGQVAAGVHALDDAMVAVATGEVSPAGVGLLYCAAIEDCQRSFELQRAREWTAALTQWCDARPDVVPYRGQCLVHRAEVLRLNGSWPEAGEQAEAACDLLVGHPALGSAFYQRAELQRLGGDLEGAETSYQQANRYGRSPQPGLALLRSAQSRAGAALAGLSRALDETEHPADRARLLEAQVGLLLDEGDVAPARAAAEELGRVAETVGQPYLLAAAACAEGAVLLAEGSPRAGCERLREAAATWTTLGTPYEAARARVMSGLAYRALGDDDGARMELDAARAVFQELGALPDVARVEALSGPSHDHLGGMTARQLDVLRLVARGMTNREVAESLVISEHTVRRHLQNIFTRLDVTSRAAATAHALRHGLL